MRLLRIEILGFKSFCDKSVIQVVQDGISVVVGPNGCGKSNIVDAIRWTLGEQSAKHLRGGAMEDVIFNGSSVRKPVSLAQVNLVFDNPEHDTISKYSEFSEITITRRLYRSGESQYLINKTPCRLTDIRELFMDTGIGGKGYSIIEQGKIDQIITSRAEDRRLIIDEAAGIMKFKSKRQDAERKFATTKQNLLRVEDILAELRNQEETLKFQVERAEEYLYAKGRLERLQQCISAKNWNRLNNEAQRLMNNRETNIQRQADQQTIVTNLSAKESALNLDIERKLKTQEDFRNRLQTKKEEIIKLESKLEADAFAKNNLEEWEKKEKEEIDLLQKQIKTIDFQIESHQTLAKNLENEYDQTAELIAVLEEQKKVYDRDLSDNRLELEQKQKNNVAILTQLTGDQNQLAHRRQLLKELQQKQERIKEQILSASADESGLKSDLDKWEEKVQQAIKDWENIKQKVEADQSNIGALQDQIKQKTSQKNALSDELMRIENRHATLLELIQSNEEFDGAAKKFLDHMMQNPDKAEDIGFIGALADLTETKSPQSESATALLNQYFNLLVFRSVDNLESIVRVIKELNTEQLRIFFLDLQANVQTKENSPASVIFTHNEKNAASLVSLTNGYQTARRPFHQIPKKQLQEANGLIDSTANIMTHEKIFLIGSQGESSPAALYFQRRSESTDLDKKLRDIKIKLESHESTLRRDEAELNNLAQSNEERKNELNQRHVSKITFEKELEAIAQEYSRLQSHKTALLEERRQIEENLERTEVEIQNLIQKIETDEKEHQALKKSIKELQLHINHTTDTKQSNIEELQQLRIKSAGLEEKQAGARATLDRLTLDCSRHQERLEELRAHSTEKKDQKKDIVLAITETKDQIPILLEELDEIEGQLKKLIDETETDRSGLLSIQNAIAGEQLKINQLRERTHKQDVRLAQLTQETQNIADNLYADNRITPEELLKTFDVRQFNIEKETENIAALKQQIGGMDDINLAAKKEYDTLLERINFLAAQSQDLNQSIATLEESINKINEESRRRFKETYNKINTQFSKTFPRLFGGGEGFLALTDETNILESGVDIIAKPPGKKLQNMNLLSGGEKALTAISLVFSIFQIKPSPFCLLDEVDAALDDANNKRFNQHVKFLTSNSQFIIITHNKKTMEIGDALFGVTMEEPGISKIVSVELDQTATDSLQKAG